MNRKEYERNLTTIVAALLASGHYTDPDTHGTRLIRERKPGKKYPEAVFIEDAQDVMGYIESSCKRWFEDFEEDAEPMHLRDPYYIDVILEQEFLEEYAREAAQKIAAAKTSEGA